MRASYDAVAERYAEAVSDELRHKPLDRAMLTAFADQVREAHPGEPRVWDVGCGPGHVTAFLAGLGLRAAGIDLSGGMIAQARRRHPDLEFRQASMTALPADAGSLAGLVSFYSLIHLIGDAAVRTALGEFRRVLTAGGLLLLAVHSGREVRHSEEVVRPSSRRVLPVLRAGLAGRRTGPGQLQRPGRAEPSAIPGSRGRHRARLLPGSHQLAAPRAS